jgi:ParB family chromosome partitioning protein
MGHARALINTPDPINLAETVIARGLSVRDTEELARKARPGNSRIAKPSSAQVMGADADIALLERQLGDLVGLKVTIEHKGQGGSVTLNYSTLDQLDMICQRLSGERI